MRARTGHRQTLLEPLDVRHWLGAVCVDRVLADRDCGRLFAAAWAQRRQGLPVRRMGFGRGYGLSDFTPP
jgi:hypothetical protein